MDNLPNSMLGKPATNTSPPDFFTFARDRGDLWGAGWYVSRAVQAYLFRLIMGTRNSQAAFNPNRDANGLYQGGLSNGLTFISYADWIAYNGGYPVAPCSAGVELGDGVGVVPFELRDLTGDVFYKGNIPVFFGLKNPYGYLEVIISGMMISCDASTGKVKTYVAPSLKGFNPAAMSAGNMLQACENIPGSSFWIKKISMHRLCGVPTEVGGSQSTYFCDLTSMPTPASPGTYLATTGGHMNMNASAGMNILLYTTSGYGQWRTAPLCYFEEDPVIT